MAINIEKVEGRQKNSDFLKATDIHKIYRSSRGHVYALKGMSFQVLHEEIVAIVGPSGCGKTTLIKILSGLLPYEGGEVSIDGNRVIGPLSKIGMVFQKPVLFEWLSIIDNVLAPIGFMGLKKSDYREKAYDLLKLTQVDGFENRYPNELSGGMQQRVSICRALIYDPDILLMDEPFGALDAMTRDVLNLELLRIWREKRKTIIFVTHSIQEAVFLADRVIILSCRPSAVREQVQIDLPRPRKIEVKGSSKYGKYTVDIYNLLRNELERVE